MPRVLEANQTCPQCGRRRGDHKRGLYVCDVPIAVFEAVERYAAVHGRTWRAKLRKEWESACSGIDDASERTLLQQARNLIGPTRIAKVRPAHVPALSR